MSVFLLLFRFRCRRLKERARKYRANFLVDSNNWYRPGIWSCINIHNTAIENDGSAELRLDLLVNAVLGDNTDVVRSNIFSYEYGIVDD